MGRSDHFRGMAAGVLVLAVGLSVRFPITSVSPLLREIGSTFGLSAYGPAVISAIPVLLFGLASPLAPLLVSRLGVERTIAILLSTLALATLVRPLTSEFLYGGTVVVGATIALLGILTPQIIRKSLPKAAGFWTGIYTTSFGVSAAAGAALTVPLLHFFGENVAMALASWGIPLLVAAALSIMFSPKLRIVNSPEISEARSHSSALQTKGLWAVTGFFGCQAIIYFSLTAWLPTIAIDRGMSPTDAGFLLAWMSIAGLPASLLAPTLAAKKKWRSEVIVFISVLSGAGIAGLAFGPLFLAPLMVTVLGIAQSAAFGLAIALIVFTSPDAERTTAFSAISQGIGYAFAAGGPMALGVLAQVGMPWSFIVALLLIAAVGELCFGLRASQASLQSIRTVHSTKSTSNRT